MNTKTEKNLHIRSNKNTISDIIQQEKVHFSSLIYLSYLQVFIYLKVHSKRSHIHRPVHQTKTSELRRLQTQSRR